MNVSDQIIQVLDNLCEKFGLVIDWTSENIILYVTVLMGKLIQWEIWSSVVYIVCAILGTIVCIVTIKYMIKHFDDLDVIAIIAIMVAGVFGLFAVGCVVDEIMDIIKCVTFPEMYVFEYVQQLIKGSS